MPGNVKLLLDCNIMEYLNSCVQSEELLPLARPALLLLEVVCVFKTLLGPSDFSILFLVHCENATDIKKRLEK